MTDTGTEKKARKTGTVRKKSPANNALTAILPWFGVLALVLVVALSAVSYLLWQQLREVESKNTELASLGSRLQQDMSSLGSRLRGSEQQYRQGITELGKRLEKLPLLAKAVSGMQKRLDRDRKGWALAEVNYLIRIAAQRLQLSRDIKTALRALQSADDRLRKLNQPDLIPVRRQLASEIQALQAIRVPDISGLTLRLDGAIGLVDKLSLRSVQRRVHRKDPGKGKGKQDVLGSIWNSLKSLVVIRRHDHKLEPMLSLEQQTGIRQILRLRLEQVRLALQGRRDQQLQQALNRSRSWLKRFFDVRSQAVKSLLGLLDELSKLELNPDLPVPSGSLKLLEALQKPSAASSPAAAPVQPGKKPADVKPAKTGAGKPGNSKKQPAAARKGKKGKTP